MDSNSEIFCAADAVIITPPLGTSLDGYFTDRKAAGVLDDLYASILYLRQGDAQLVWIACDLIGVPAAFTRPIRQQIAAQLGMPESAVFLSATHTHTGPYTQGPLVDTAYLDSIARRITQGVVATAARARPAALEYAHGIEPRFAFNRRYHMRDGSVMTNPGANNPEVTGPAGSVDHSLHVLCACDRQGGPLAVLVNCANHSDTTDGSLISADWPGHLRARLQQAIGAELPVLVLNGAAGDVNHFDVFNNHIVQSPEESQRIGHGYAETALRLLALAQPLFVDQLRSACQTVPVPYRAISAEELSAAQQVVAELQDDPEARLDGHLESQDIARGNKAVRLMFAQELVDAAEKYAGKTLDLEVCAARIGTLALVGINGEVFSDIGLSIREDSPIEHTLVTELVNGYIGYLGTRKAYAQGGYETLLGGRVSDNVEEYIYRAAGELLEELAPQPGASDATRTSPPEPPR